MRPEIGKSGDEIPVEPLVEHTEESNSRMRKACLVRRFGQIAGSRRGKVIDVNTAWKRMDILVQLLLGFVETAAAGEDDAGAAQQCAFGLAKAGRSAGKIREFIHAVVHDRGCIQMVAEAQRHRRVVPQHLGPDVFSYDQVIKEPALHVAFALAIELA